MKGFPQEWLAIHGDIERYERCSLGIKLCSVLVSLFAFSGFADGGDMSAVIAVLWLQDGIWKTFQQRLEARIIAVEKMLVEQKPKAGTSHNGAAFQLYSQWQDSRPGMAELIMTYLRNAFRPTVIYPYVPLVFLTYFF